MLRAARCSWIVGVLAAAAFGLVLPQAEESVIDPSFHHLGDDETPEWPEAPSSPTPAPLVLSFRSATNAEEWTLRYLLRHVDERWTVRLNGTEIGELQRGQGRREAYLRVPPGIARDGANELRIECGRAGDDITIGNFRLARAPFHRLFGLGRLLVRVRDPLGQAVPARITVAGLTGERPDLQPVDLPGPVLRPGVAYSAPDVEAAFWLPAGDHAVYASRGFEWSRDLRHVTIEAGGTCQIELAIERQVSTRGFVAADTHVHTYTYSGHGDASVDERIATLAGEGVELAVATDHNHQTDYRPRQLSLGMGSWFTSVVGNEVTTSNGHFNAFPLAAGGPLPDHRITEWSRLVSGIRAAGAKVVILNHPRWPVGDSPFDRFGLDPRTGADRAGIRFTMDAIEIFNSTTDDVDPERNLRDWFGLLNAGARLVAVGSSDSHTVGDPVGQGRTYVRCVSEDPAAIDVAAACEALLAGVASCSLGLYAELILDGVPAMGRTLTAGRGDLRFQVRVAAPHWSRPETVSIYLDGFLVEERPVPAEPGRPTDLRLDFSLPPLDHDAWLVAVARGPRVEEPFWRGSMPLVAAVTNPVRLDDGDGVWRSARERAATLLERLGAVASVAEITAELRFGDPALLEQSAVLLQHSRPDAFAACGQLPGPHQAAFQAYRQQLENGR